MAKFTEIQLCGENHSILQAVFKQRARNAPSKMEKFTLKINYEQCTWSPNGSSFTISFFRRNRHRSSTSNWEIFKIGLQKRFKSMSYNVVAQKFISLPFIKKT